MKTLVISGLTGLLGLAVGYGMGSFVREAPSPAPPTRVEPAPAAKISPAPISGKQPESDEALEACQAKLNLAQALWDQSLAAAAGEPIAFPEALPAAYTPQEFETTVDQIIANCQEQDLVKRHVDCDEYPCLAFLTGGSLRKCPGYAKAFPSAWATSSSDKISLEVGDIAFTAIGPLAEGHTAGGENGSKRKQRRLELGKQLLFDDLGGVELSETERLDREIVFWRAQSKAGNEAAEQMLKLFESRRAALE